MKEPFSTLKQFLGITQAPVSHSEKILSALGGFIAIFLLIVINQIFLDLPSSWALVASMGASAVLLFAVPHGALSQPWPLLGGNLSAAFIGVSCALFIDEPILAASCAVGLSILAMYYLKCIHPPGGATALTAVIGGESIHELGYQFLITPVLLNVLAIFAVAMMFNFIFHWRRYPAYLNHYDLFSPHSQLSAQETTQTPASISHEDFIEALKQIDSFVGVNEDEVKRIFELANYNAAHSHLTAQDIHLGSVYSNGHVSKEWSMRQIIDESPSTDPQKDFVIFKQIAGQQATRSDCITRSEFAQWAKYPMVKDGDDWKRQEIQEIRQEHNHR
ncbi:HPP family protein [Thiomicrorhabdus arctica]|uniref:HPP family protein n=1 Tax=Thiomicrorhabdus arctica TaxID=131540 RepID=UPI000377F827|nr:HPP family protein [Thiomicrorhabdus arctica]